MSVIAERLNSTMLTDARAIAAPFRSVTRPLIPVVDCAVAGPVGIGSGTIIAVDKDIFVGNAAGAGYAETAVVGPEIVEIVRR